jgi:hypothetical protein
MHQTYATSPLFLDNLLRALGNMIILWMQCSYCSKRGLVAYVCNAPNFTLIVLFMAFS